MGGLFGGGGSANPGTPVPRGTAQGESGSAEVVSRAPKGSTQYERETRRKRRWWEDSEGGDMSEGLGEAGTESESDTADI